MACELPDGWTWQRVDTVDRLCTNNPDHMLTTVDNTAGYKYRTYQSAGWSVQPAIHHLGPDESTAEARLIAAVLALRGELPPVVRDVLARVRTEYYAHRLNYYEHNIVGHRLLRDLDALLGTAEGKPDA